MGHPSQHTQISRRTDHRVLQTAITLQLTNAKANFTQWWKKQPDNWSTRQICGTHCKGVPKYQLTRDHLEYTLTRLSNFHTVLFQEQLQQSVTTLAQRLQWNQSNLTQVQELITRDDEQKKKKKLLAAAKRVKVVKKLPPPSPKPKQLSKEQHLQEWDPLMSALDDALHEIAKQWEQKKDSRNTTGITIDGWENLLTSQTRKMVAQYLDDQPNNHRHQCENECCADLCSAW